MGMTLVIVFGGLFLFFVLFALWGISVYNGLVALRNRYKNAFAQIDVQLKRRYDLIPNLVETVKKYMVHERETLEAVVQARNIASGAAGKAAADPSDPQAMRQLNSAEGQLTGSLSKMMLLVEAYPDLKADKNMLAFQEELTSTENKVAFARQSYNDSVMGYNNGREVFPSSIVAGMFQFGPAALFEVDNPAEKQAPKVSF